MFRILICTILPLTFMFAISLLFTRDFIEKTIEEDRTTTLQTAASAIKSAYVYGYEGEYMVDGSGTLFKERQDLQVIIPCLIHLRKRQELNQPFTMAMKSK